MRSWEVAEAKSAVLDAGPSDVDPSDVDPSDVDPSDVDPSEGVVLS